MAGQPDRYGQEIGTIRQSLLDANGIYAYSAQQSGGTRRLAVLAGISNGICEPVVDDVVVPGSAASDLGSLAQALSSQGLDRTDRKYLVYLDATNNSYCGLAMLAQDDSDSVMNTSNAGGDYAEVFQSNNCFAGYVAAHELTHLMGGVQRSAPHATPGGHCTDGADLMCYADGSTTQPQTSTCPTSQRFMLDCGKNDYFSAASRTNPYLQTHWNVANSSFLFGGGTPVPTPPGPASSLSASTTHGTVTLTWRRASGRVVNQYVQSSTGQQLARLGPTVTSWIDNSPALGATNNYQLSASNEAGDGPAVTVSVFVPPDPNSPIPTGAVPSTTGLDVRFTPRAYTDTVVIYRDGRQVARVPGSAANWMDTATTLGRSYSYTLIAVNVTGQSSPAQEPTALALTPSPAIAPTPELPPIYLHLPVAPVGNSSTI